MNVSFLLIAPALFLFSTQTLLSQSTLCSPPSSKAFTSFNNVRALVENNGSMWQDRNMTRASYEVQQKGVFPVFMQDHSGLVGFRNQVNCRWQPTHLRREQIFILGH